MNTAQIKILTRNEPTSVTFASLKDSAIRQSAQSPYQLRPLLKTAFAHKHIHLFPNCGWRPYGCLRLELLHLWGTAGYSQVRIRCMLLQPAELTAQLYCLLFFQAF